MAATSCVLVDDLSGRIQMMATRNFDGIQAVRRRRISATPAMSNPVSDAGSGM